MSFVRLDSGEFPPLGAVGKLNQQSRNSKSNRKININNDKVNTFKKVCILNDDMADKNSQESCSKSESCLSRSSSSRSIDKSEFDESELLETVPTFTSAQVSKCRVGLHMKEFNCDLENVLRRERIGTLGDFIITPIEGTRVEVTMPNVSLEDQNQLCKQSQISLLPDLALPCETWQTRVALELKYPTQGSGNPIQLARHFERIFTHALYLSAPIIIVSCPESEAAYVSMAAIINSKLGLTKQTFRLPLVLIKVPIMNDKNTEELSTGWFTEVPLSGPVENAKSPLATPYTGQSNTRRKNIKASKNPDVHYKSADSILNTSDDSGYNTKGKSLNSQSSRNAWRHWNSIRSHLDADVRIGVCLSIDDDLSEHNHSELAKWAGEPVRLIILHVNQFSRSRGDNSTQCLPLPCLDFIKSIIYGNSLNTSLAIQGNTTQDVREYLTYLCDLTSSIRESDMDRLREWDDRIQPPLQPLSVNLDSGTYQVFESDAIKYTSYRSAMLEALQELVYNRNKTRVLDRKYILMVLGAGRGPLVDAFIQAIKELNSGAKFKIYALDKNPCSIQSLLFKQNREWRNLDEHIETEIIESDMRTWEPGMTADVIASELLGSLGDNELSPECLDGTFRLSTPETICIPQEYTSWIQPISSYKLYQELSRIKDIDSLVFDQIYVTRLTNYYEIDEVQPLFHFEHKDLSLPSSMRDNCRYSNIVFWSKIDTVCHGLGGYFSANLYGSVVIATVPHMKTQNMDSWFPVFIPFERPIQMPKGSRLEVHFWRKESASKVWYEWALTRPERTRIHGLKSAMSKSI